ncbi:MAG: hypothetical protein Q8R53_05445, partial [Nanoarchaeota archaeon]|nr:hypothetical protein [Nanoarchaeota archaeon]
MLGTIVFGGVEGARIERELQKVGIYRLNEIAAEQQSMLPALGLCYTGYVTTGSSTQYCTDLVSQYLVLRQEHDALTNVPAYRA